MFGRLVLFTLTSSISYIGMLLIIFSLFRIPYRWYIPHMAFVCVSLSYISFTTREASFALYTPFIQMGFLIVLLWLLFRFHPFHAVIMGVTGGICFGFLDVAVGYLFAVAGFGLVQFSIQMHLTGVLSGLLGIGLAAFISKRSWGFSFVREDEQVRINFREKNNVLLITVCLIAIIAFFAGYFFIIHLSTPSSFIFTVIVQFLGAGLLIYLSGKREQQEYEKKRGRFWIGK